MVDLIDGEKLRVWAADRRHGGVAPRRHAVRELEGRRIPDEEDAIAVFPDQRPDQGRRGEAGHGEGLQIAAVLVRASDVPEVRGGVNVLSADVNRLQISGVLRELDGLTLSAGTGSAQAVVTAGAAVLAIRARVDAGARRAAEGRILLGTGYLAGAVDAHARPGRCPAGRRGTGGRAFAGAVTGAVGLRWSIGAHPRLHARVSGIEPAVEVVRRPAGTGASAQRQRQKKHQPR